MEIGIDHQEQLASQGEKQTDFISLLMEEHTGSYKVILVPHPQNQTCI